MQGSDLAAGEALWRFSLALYARPGIADALIALQDRAGRDVNLILLCVWLGAAKGAAIDAPGLCAIAADVAPLNEGAVAPLRDLRRGLKAAEGDSLRALRRRVLVLELAAERQVQHRLAAAAARFPGGAGDRLAVAEANLALYLGSASGSREAGVLRQALAEVTRRAGRPAR